MKLGLKVATVVLIFLAVQAYADPIVPVPSADAAAMAAALGGPGIAIVPGSEVYVGAATQGGFFLGGAGVLAFDTGILLTSGSVFNTPGPNTSGSAGASTGTGGDVDLGGFDRNILEFDFVPAAGVISFQYEFGSEEYNEWVGSSFNDAFAFYLNGVNIALVPATLSPVAINSINCGSNPAYYRSNSGGPCDSGPLNTQLDGLVGGLGSLALYATGPVAAGDVNHIKLVIVDRGDTIYDSAVFLKGGSFKPEPPPNGIIPEPSTLILLGTGLAATARSLRKRLG